MLDHPMAVAALFILCTLLTAPAHGREESTCPVEYRDSVPVRLASTIRLDLSPEVPREVVDRAIQLWEGCEGYGEDFPRFVLRGQADRSIRARFEQGRPGDGRCASLFRGEIVLYATAHDASGRLRTCGAPGENLAHELGHVLGLGDVTKRRGCRLRIMSPLLTGPSKNLAGRAVQPEECRAVSDHWWTRSERVIEERKALPAEAASATPR